MMICPVGQDMMMKAMLRQPMPKVVTIFASDSAKVKKVKEVIAGMVQYTASDRLKMRTVMNILGGVLGCKCYML